MSRKCVRLFASASLLILTSCAQTMASSGPTEPRVLDTFCAYAKPIYWSARDTDETILAAKEHNAVGKDRCGWGRSPNPTP